MTISLVRKWMLKVKLQLVIFSCYHFALCNAVCMVRFQLIYWNGSSLTLSLSLSLSHTHVYTQVTPLTLAPFYFKMDMENTFSGNVARYQSLWNGYEFNYVEKVFHPGLLCVIYCSTLYPVFAYYEVMGNVN